MSSADWLVQNLNTVISKTAMRPSSVKLRSDFCFELTLLLVGYRLTLRRNFSRFRSKMTHILDFQI